VESWDDDFSDGDIQVPDNIAAGHARLQNNLLLVRMFANTTRELERLLLSVPQDEIKDSLLDVGCILEALKLVALANEDRSAPFFSTEIGRKFLVRLGGTETNKNAVSVDEDSLKGLVDQAQKLVPEVRQYLDSDNIP
jgi:hypothetical protein